MAEKLLLKELSRYALGTWADIIYRNALLYPKQEAFICDDDRVTFASYNARVNQLVRGLQSLGMQKGDGFGVLAWNCLEYICLYGAAMKGGFIISPLNPRLQASELEQLINYSKIKALFVGPEFMSMAEKLRASLPHVQIYVTLGAADANMTSYAALLASSSDDEPDVELAETDPFVIFYTSGTTGVPRGALYTQGRNIEHTRTRALHAGIAWGDKHVMILPLFHIGGYSHFWAFFYMGASNFTPCRSTFDPADTLRFIQDEKATDIHIVPTHLVTLLAVPGIDRYDLSSLKRIWYAASPMPVDLLRRGMDKFGAIFLQGYGQSETGPDITVLSREGHGSGSQEGEDSAIGSCGRPCLGVHARIVDSEGNDVEPGAVGEIVVQSKHLMVEYWEKPDDTSETVVGGWLHTGDLGVYDSRGFLYIVGRKKEMIITGGENVYPREVEEILYTHPAISEAVVIGLPDDLWVERVHAVIVLKEGETLSDREAIHYCRERLAAYKTPKTVTFVPSLPKNPQGKISKKDVKTWYVSPRAEGQHKG